MIVKAKIGTHQGKTMKVRKLQLFPKPGQRIKAMPYDIWKDLLIKSNKWIDYRVEKIEGETLFLTII